jgi:hypothetical protein
VACRLKARLAAARRPAASPRRQPHASFAVYDGETEMTAEDKLALCEKVIARWLEDELQGDTAMVSITAILYPGLMSEDQVRWEATGPRPTLN